MSAKKISRREMLKGLGLAMAGTALAACAPKVVKETVIVEKPVEKVVKETVVVQGTPQVVEKVVTATPAPVKEVTLDVGASNPEYSNAERQIWDVFEAEHPGIKIQLFDVNEDTEAAFRAKVAGGYLPAMAPEYHFVSGRVNKENYDNFVDLSKIDFPYWDRFTYDALHAWPDLFGLPGPRTIQIWQGFVYTWEFHQDLMEKAGLDPRRDVKTWDDLLKWLDEGAKWAKSTPEVDYFWDQGWHTWVWGACYADVIPLAFPDGQRDRQIDCWMGKAKFNAPDSPYRHFLEFFKTANDKGWIPENCWTREWETDMEASYISKKSVMMLHGPWPWDKMLAADPTAKQLGLPATPPAEGQKVWMQYMGPVEFDSGYCMLKGVLDLPEWPQIREAFIWWHSPKVIKMRAEAHGQPVMYRTDEPIELSGPQWLGVLKDIGTPGGLWEDVQYPKEVMVGEKMAAPYRKGGSPGVWDWESGAIVGPISDLLSGKKTVKDVLDWAQANWDASYEGLPQ